MANVGELLVDIRANTNTIHTQLNQLGQSLQTFGSQSQSMLSNALSFAGGQAIFEGVKTAIEGVVTSGITFNAQLQNNSIAFEGMLGSAKKAEDMLKEITSFAANTPFEIRDLTNSAQQLLAFGIEGDKVIPIMKMLGDVSGGNNEKFKSLTLAFSQISAAGKLSGQDLLQLVNVGFNPLKIISEKTGVSMEDLRAKMEKGQISAKMVTDTLKVATSDGGLFFDRMAKGAQSFDGRMSTLKDNINITLGRVMKPIFDYLAEVALPRAIKLAEQFAKGFELRGLQGALEAVFPKKVVDTLGDIYDGAKRVYNVFMEYLPTIKLVASAVAGGVIAFKTLTLALGGAQMAMAIFNAVMSANPISLIIIAVGALVTAGIYLYKNWDEVSANLSKLWSNLKFTVQNTFLNMSIWVKESISKIMTYLNDLTGGIVGVVDSLFGFKKELDMSIEADKAKQNALKISKGYEDYHRAIEESNKKMKEHKAVVEEVIPVQQKEKEKLDVSSLSFNDLSKNVETATDKKKKLKEETSDLINKLKDVGTALKDEIDQIKSFQSEAKTEFDTLGEAIVTAFKTRNREIEESYDAKVERVRELNQKEYEDTVETFDKETEAQQEAYDKSYNKTKDRLTKEIEDVKAASNEKIASYRKEADEKERTYYSVEDKKQLDAIQSQIDAIDDKTKAENEAIRVKEYNDKLQKAEYDMMNMERNSTQRYEKNKEILEMISDEERRQLLLKRDREKEDLKTTLDLIKEQQTLAKSTRDQELQDKIKAEEESLKNQVKSNEDALKNQKTLYEQRLTSYNENRKTERANVLIEFEDEKKDFEERVKKQKERFKVLNDETVLNGAAQKLLETNNQDKIIELLGTYNPKWQDAGKSFGEKMIEGLNSMKAPIQTAVNDILSLVGKINNVATQNAIIVQAKNLWNQASSLGNTDLMREASKIAESARSLGGNIGANVNVNAAMSMVPAMATGTNSVPQDMLAYLHQGEAVVPKKYNNGSQGLSINISGNTFGNRRDIDYMGDMLVQRLRSAGIGV